MEIDQVKATALTRLSISGISKLGDFALKYSSSIPSFGLLGPALNLASNVSKRALHSYSKADKVLAIDLRFLLAERKKTAEEP